MTQYLLARCKGDDELISSERSRQVRAGVNAGGDKMTDARAFVFKAGMQGGPEPSM